MLRIQLKPSKLLASWIIVWPLFVGSIIWFSAMPLFFVIFLDLAIAVYAVKLWLDHFKLFGCPTLIYRDEEWCWLQGSSEQTLFLKNEFYLSAWLIVLRFRCERGKDKNLVILLDSTSKDELRQLRVCLRHGLAGAESA